jgi:hypothetical protein
VSTTTPKAHHYKVTKQEAHTQLTPEGATQKVWTVHLEHSDPGQTKGTVELPDHLYTAENVHTMASAQANDIHAVAQLPASVTPKP